MGFCSKFIQLIQGLVENSESVIHINGAFTAEFQLERGVRQGCPIAPLLFALSTQPLMEMLKDVQVKGTVQGIQLGDSMQILEALFADDTGLLLKATENNWKGATEVIQKFEVISGAKLNVMKSLAIPIGFTEPPLWLKQTGCKIANAGEIWTYLGCPIGVKISEEQILQFMLDKMTNRLQHWTTRMLSWESRVVLTRHILMVLPTYVLMVVGLTKDGYNELTKVCRRFVWGAKTLNLRMVSQLMENALLDWTHIAKAIIEWKVLSTQCRQEEIGDTAQEVLLFGKRLRLFEAPTLNRMLDGWWDARPQLELKPEAKLPSSLRLALALKLITKEIRSDDGLARGLSLLKKIEIQTLGELNEERLGLVEDWDRRTGLQFPGGPSEGPVTRAVGLLRSVMLRRLDQDSGLSDPALWVWTKWNVRLEGWKHSTQDWRKLLGEMEYVTDAALNVTEEETTEHCFLGCNQVQTRWRHLHQNLALICLIRTPSPKLLEWLDGFLRDSNGLPHILLLVTHTRVIWKERCAMQYESRRETRPGHSIVSESMNLARELIRSKGNSKKIQRLEATVSYLELLHSILRNDDLRRQADTHRLCGTINSSRQQSIESPHTSDDTELSEESVGSASSIDEDPSRNSRDREHEALIATLDAVGDGLSNLGFT
ncbi:hypothetical protein R1sor_016011 [Riccia sorocarpa]|uniref:Reverse transcriptase domain-containing protein n=1 Tax=Riccia sorocarpa TaxID=122646 RepID=A0ABD3HDU1_9MARC